MGKQIPLQFSWELGAPLQFFAERQYTPQFQPGSDFWRAFLDTGDHRELAVYASAQTPAAVHRTPDKLTVVYDTLIAEDGRCFSMDLTVDVALEDGTLHFSAEISNHDVSARLNELQLPFLDICRFSGEPEQEVLYTSTRLGRREENPRALISGMHTEYTCADEKITWFSMHYPYTQGSASGLSMPWIGLQSGDYFLYFAHHQSEFYITGIEAGVPPRGEESRLILAQSSYPAVQPGETVRRGGAVVALFQGDWRDGSAYYRAWSDQTWHKTKHTPPDWVKYMTGWQRIIMRHQYGDLFFRYSDLPRIYDAGVPYGLHTLLVFGWWKGCFDNHYPEYEPDPEMGGTEGLRNAICKIHEKGGRVLLYSNGNLIDVKTDYYRREGWHICAKDIDENEYREHYRFSNDGTLLRTGGYKSFVNACHSNPEWHDKLIETGNLKLSFGADSIFYDQLCCRHKFCFDTSHPHGKRIDLEPEYRMQNILDLMQTLGPDQALGTEHLCDRYLENIDYIHGCMETMMYTPESFPDMYLQTFPEYIISNRNILDEKTGFRDHLNYAFVTGLIFDVSIFRGRRVDISAMPAYGAHLRYLLDWKERYREFFYDGKFSSTFGEKLPDGVRANRFTHEDRFVVAYWNKNPYPVEATLYGKTTIIPADDVTVCEYWD